MAKISMDGTKLDFTPIGSKVALRPHKVSETPKGVVLPDSLHLKPVAQSSTGTVMAVGPDVKQVKIGDVVAVADDEMVYPFFRGNIKLILVEESKVLGVIQE